MARTPQDVTETELAVLQHLWESPEATIRQITQRLYPGGRASEYATVQKLLDRLAAKRYVRRQTDALPHSFCATVERDELIGRRLRNMADKLCGGSLTPVLTHLISSRALKKRELEELRGLIDRLERGGRKVRR